MFLFDKWIDHAESSRNRGLFTTTVMVQQKSYEQNKKSSFSPRVINEPVRESKLTVLAFLESIKRRVAVNGLHRCIAFERESLRSCVKLLSHADGVRARTIRVALFFYTAVVLGHSLDRV